MTFSTQQEQADLGCEKIKNMIKASLLDFLINESPFWVHFQLRKTFIKDYSPKLETISSTPSPMLNKVPVTPLSSTLIDQNNDSGIYVIDSNELVNVRNELVQSLIEICSLKEDVKAKDSIIFKLKDDRN